jgi:TolA-binding protein
MKYFFKYFSPFIIASIFAVAISLSIESCEPLDNDMGQEPRDTTGAAQDTSAMQHATPPMKPAEAQTLANRVDSLNTALNETNDRINGVSEELAAVKDLMQSQPPGQNSDAISNPQGSYKQGLDLFFSRQYQESIGKFQQLLDAGKPEGMQGNCQYWIGECYYGLHQYNEALKAFKNVFTYENTPKADAAQIMVGETYLHLGNSARARSAFRELIRKYPSSEYVPRARKILASMS